MRLSIQTTLALFFLVIMVLSLPVFLYLSLRISTQMIDQQVRRQLESETAESVGVIELVLRPVENVISRLSENYTRLSYLRARSRLQAPDLDEDRGKALLEEEEIYRWGATDEFRRLLRLNPEFARVAFVARDGTVLLEEFAAGEAPLQGPLRTLFDRALNGTRGIPVVEDRVRDEGILRYAIPVVRDENVGVEDQAMQPAIDLLGSPVREKEGVLILDYRFASLEEKILATRVSGARGGAFFLIDAEGHLLAAPERYRNLLQEMLRGWREHSRAEIIEGRYAWQGQEYLTSLWPYSERRWHVGIVAPQNDFTFYLEQASWKLILASIVLFGIALGVALILIRRISSPLEKFGALAREIAQGNFAVRVRPEGSREVSNLAGAFNHMAGQLEAFVAEIREKERMEGELKIAHRIQAGLLPERLPDVPGIALDARTIPAREVGGDYYDFLPNGGGGFALAIADVTGRGVPAALVMSMIRSLLRGQAEHGTPDEVLRRINDLIHRDVRGSRHSVAMFFSVFDPATRRLTFANAGQMFPLWYRKSEDRWTYLDLSGIPLGIIPEFVYRSREIQLQPGDRVIFYTDGIVEAMNGGKELFGFERFEALLRESVKVPSGQTLEFILTRLRSFAGHPEPDDDLTLALLEVIE